MVLGCGCGVALVVCVSVVRVWLCFGAVVWFFGAVFWVGFWLSESLRGVFTPARNGSLQGAHGGAPSLRCRYAQVGVA